MTPLPIPRYVDAQPMVYFWELDEFIVLSSLSAMGYWMGGYWTITGMAAGFIGVSVFKRYKGFGLPGQLAHLMHWHNISNINSVYIQGGVKRYRK